MRRAHHRVSVLGAIVLALLITMGTSGCTGMDLLGITQIKDSLKFGDETVSKNMTVYRMDVPVDELGNLVRDEQIDWYARKYADKGAECQRGDHAACEAARSEAVAELKSNVQIQCDSLRETVQEESPDEGTWKRENRSCVKSRDLSWLEATLWNMYSTQSEETISWLSTSRDTLKASERSLGTLQNNDEPNYDGWFGVFNKYLPMLEGILAVCAAISLVVLGVRVVSNTREGLLGEDHHLLDKAGWIFLGVFLGSSCVSIALTVFSKSQKHYNIVDGHMVQSTAALQSWTPGNTGGGYYVSDWVRMQVDPFLIIAAVLGVLVAGYKLVTNQEGRDLIPFGKAMLWAAVTAVCLAGAVSLLTGTVDDWTSDVLRRASNMMKNAWQSNTLSASSFFKLDPLLAVCLTVIMWLCNVIGKVFTYLRAGLLPILVGIAPTFAVMSWNEHGRQSFAKVLGWLVAFLLYKPVAALTMATGAAIMATAGVNDDSQVVTLTLTIMVVVMLPAMVKTIVPAVSGSVSGGGVMPAVLGTVAGATGGAIAGGLKHGPGAARGLRNAMRKGASAIGGRSSAPDGAKQSAGSATGVIAAATGAGAAGAPSAVPSGGTTEGAGQHQAGRAGGAATAPSKPSGGQQPRADGSSKVAYAAAALPLAMTREAEPGQDAPPVAPAPSGAAGGTSDGVSRARENQQNGGLRTNGF